MRDEPGGPRTRLRLSNWSFVRTTSVKVWIGLGWIKRGAKNAQLEDGRGVRVSALGGNEGQDHGREEGADA